MVALFSVSVLATTMVYADRFQEQINQLSAENTQKRANQSILSTEASSLTDAINRLQAEINASQARIDQLNGEIAELRRQQAIENARLFARSGGVVNVPDSSGYPWANYRSGSWTHAGSCYYGDDVDPWGMCYRQCVSYTAWKVWKEGRFMPNWGGRGNANNWDDNARAAGFRVDNTPARGAIAISNYGTWGHAMFVESVNPNGTINISQYNVGLTGEYSEAYNMSANGLVFIHFPPR